MNMGKCHGNQTPLHNSFHLLEEDDEEESDMLAVTLPATQSVDLGWHKITAVVDSGSAENAMPEESVPLVKTSPSSGSKKGKVYRGAGGEAIPNQGQKNIVVRTAEGQVRRSHWQICPVKRPLMSVARITAAGNSVHLAEANPHIKNDRTGETTKLRTEGNVFLIDLWVRVPGPPGVKSQAQTAMDVDSGFPRQGR